MDFSVLSTPSRAPHARRAWGARVLVSLAGVLMLLCASQPAGAFAQTGDPPSPPPQAEKDQPSASATLEQCVTSMVQAERSATFSGEIVAIQGSAHMAMRIDVQERTPAEALFHTVTAPGLGVWRASDPGVKNYKYLKQVTNLSAPALYRATVRFRWVNAKGHLIRHAERHTPSCAQPPSPPPGSPSSPTAPPSSARLTRSAASRWMDVDRKRGGDARMRER